MSALTDNVFAAAARIEHEWDARAIDWPLNEQSIVVEVGGYTGRWALQIAERYHCRLEVFEPQPWAAAVCAEVLRPYNASVLPWGVGVRDEELPMGGWETDGCSFVKAADGQTCKLAEASQVLPPHIDLMLMNIEGYEYTLLPHMLDCGILPDRLMVQFHEYDPTATGRLFARLADAGYRVVWTYGLVLTAWEMTR